MAFAGRLRSNVSIFHRILRTESVLAQRTGLQRSSEIPNFPLTESLRNYVAAPGSKEEKVKVPLALFGVSGNYASALFLSASKANLLDKVESEILDIVEASKKSPIFSQFLRDLSVPGETRVKAMQDIFSEAGFSDLTKNFLAILAENGRLRHIENIAKSFVELTMAHRGEVKAIVTTVIPSSKNQQTIMILIVQSLADRMDSPGCYEEKPLPTEEEKQLKETLQDIIGHGKSVKLEQKIDQSILGGLVVEFGQKLFDMSIRTRARQMEKFLRNPVNFESL